MACSSIARMRRCAGVLEIAQRPGAREHQRRPLRSEPDLLIHDLAFPASSNQPI